MKRDRMVVVCLHRSSKNLVLFPYVFYMAGEGAPSGDAMELTAPYELRAVGKQLVRLLAGGKKVDIEAVKVRRMQQLRKCWRNEPAPKVDTTGARWKQLISKYPALAKGPGTYLRQFSVCELIERDGWDSRKLMRVEQSSLRGCTTEGTTKRIATTESSLELGKQVLLFLAEKPQEGRR